MDKKDLAKITIKKVTDTNIVAWESLLSKILSFRSRSYCLKKASRVITIRNQYLPFYQFQKNYGYLAKEEMLVGRYTKEKEDIEKVVDLIHQVFHYVKNPRLCDQTVAEILTKVLAYRNLDTKVEIELPILFEGNIRLVPYKVDREFNLWNYMKAFGLIPKEGPYPPILIFRGTEFNFTSVGGRTSIVSNFDPEGPGFSVYQHARPAINRWLSKTTSTQTKARVMGYSLGGALAAYAMITDPHFFSKKPEEVSFLFHHPGINQKLLEQWQSIPNDERPLVEGFVAQGDFVSKYGKLFCPTYELIVKDHSLPPIESHTSLFFIKKVCNLAEIDLEEENASSSRNGYSKFHETTSKLMYKAGIRFLLPSDEEISDDQSQAS